MSASWMKHQGMRDNSTPTELGRKKAFLEKQNAPPQPVTWWQYTRAFFLMIYRLLSVRWNRARIWTFGERDNAPMHPKEIAKLSPVDFVPRDQYRFEKMDDSTYQKILALCKKHKWFKGKRTEGRIEE